MKECELQKMIVQYLTYRGLLFYSTITQAQKRGYRTISFLKSQGFEAGIPDILVFEKSLDGKYCGLALELKVGKNTLTKEQSEWLESLMARGWYATVVRDFDTAKYIIEKYLNHGSCSQEVIYEITNEY